ncbi:MAG TPA: hypothetical protein VG370_14480 [Chloroflexota bacterium]|nr:hypothetical protein [Chloroflexota bacterium]
MDAQTRDLLNARPAPFLVLDASRASAAELCVAARQAAAGGEMPARRT